jgi:hypothetical protein
MTVARCECGASAFRLRVDAGNGVGLATCSNDHHHLLLDSRDHWLDVIQDGRPKESKCRCGQRAFSLEFAYALRDDGDVREVEVAGTCVGCKKRRALMTLEIDYSPTRALIERPLDRIDDPWKKARQVQFTAWWRPLDAIAFSEHMMQHTRAFIERFREPPRDISDVCQPLTTGTYLAIAFGDQLPAAPLRDAWRTAPVVTLSSPMTIHYSTGIAALYYIEWAEQVFVGADVVAQPPQFLELAARVRAFLGERFISRRGKNTCDAPEEYARLQGDVLLAR